ncbi:MAG: hypothetical protein ACKOVA_04920 [Novosphingobium sp.]
MKILLATTTALLLTAMPAHAQLIGGGGIGGTLSGTLGGAGSIGSVGSPMDTISSATRGTASSTANTTGSQTVNRKSGAVHADRSANANGGGSIAQTVSTPTRMISGSGSGSASGSASSSADAQLIGTDAVRQTAGSVAGTARGAVSGAANAGRSTAGAMGQAAGSAAGNANGNAMGSANGSANGLFSGAAGQLVAAGSLAAAGDANFEVSKGMRVLGPDGDRLGKVRGVIADSHGQVQALLVKVDGATATLPAANFSGSGNALVSAMGEGQIKDAAVRQEKAPD